MTHVSHRFALGIIAGLGVLALIFLPGCSSNSGGTNPPPAVAGTLTFSLEAPVHSTVEGHEVGVMLVDLSDSTVAASCIDTMTSGAATVILPDVAPGTYFVHVLIDFDSTGIAEPISYQNDDPFWATPHLAVDGDQTITVGEYYWQRYTDDALIAVFENIPAAQNGKIIGAGLFPEGTDVLSTTEPEPIAGGAGYVYDGASVIAINYEVQQGLAKPAEPIPYATYDLWSLVDIDGQVDDWFSEEGGAGGFEGGDLVDHFSIVIDDGSDLFTTREGQYEALQAYQIAFTYSVPADWQVPVRNIYAYFFEQFDSTGPVAMSSVTLNGLTAHDTLTRFAPGTYQVLVVIDLDESMPFDEGEQLSYGDLMWGALDLPLLAGTLNVNITDSLWQEFQGIVYGVKGFGTGHNGQPLAVALYEPGAEILNPNRTPVYAGAAVICYNSAVVAVHANDQPQLARSAMAPANFDAYYLVDVDGHISDYAGSEVHPITVGDQYFKETISVDPVEGGYFEPTGTYLPVIGVSGTVSCPSWDSGDIYVYLFHENPFTAPEVDVASRAILTAPGDFTLPCLSNDSVFVLGFWDQDNSGDDGGPTAGDLLGAYGVAVDGSLEDMDKVGTSTLSTSGKDFTLWMENTPQLIRFIK